MTPLVSAIVLTLIAQSDPWVDRVIDASPSLDGSGLYNDPSAALGPPTLSFIDAFYRTEMVASLVVPVTNVDRDGHKLLLTLRSRQFVKLEFDEPVEDDPRNPFGIDLLVFGNSFFVASDFVGPDTSMDDVWIVAPVASEDILVAVSATGIGDPDSDPDEWYVYRNGPTGDGLYPTNAFLWNECANDWGPESDFTRPVDPSLSAFDFVGMTAAEAIRAYRRSGGGAGFDLAESGFSQIRFVYLTGRGGEVDALADVAPMPGGFGDADFDGDADLADFALLSNCWTSFGGVIGDCNCIGADLDCDLDIDLDDYAEMQECMTGPR